MVPEIANRGNFRNRLKCLRSANSVVEKRLTCGRHLYEQRCRRPEIRAELIAVFEDPIKYVLAANVIGVKQRPTTIAWQSVLMEKNTQGAVKIADHVYLLQGGKVILSQPANEVNMEELHQHYFAR